MPEIQKIIASSPGKAKAGESSKSPYQGNSEALLQSSEVKEFSVDGEAKLEDKVTVFPKVTSTMMRR